MENLTNSGNQPTVLSNQHLTRQLDLIPIDKLSVPVTIVGCGAIGSFTALALVKMGVTRLTVYDHDSVSIENMSNQFFRFSDIGKNKAHALASLIKDFTGVDVKLHARKFEEVDVQKTSGILIVAVDSMEARQWIANEVKRIGFGVRLVIDPRMGAEHYTQYTMNVFNEKDAETYKKTMYSDSEAVQERCTAKSTVYTATLAAGLITKTLKNYILDEDYPRSIQWDIKSAENTSMQMFAGNVAAPSL